MKWWYVVFLIVGVMFGWLVIKRYGVKTSTKVDIIMEDGILAETKKIIPKYEIDKVGKKTEMVELFG